MHMTTLQWAVLVAATLLFVITVTLVIKFREKLKLALLKLKTLDWYALYEKAQKSGALDKVVNFVNSRKKNQ